MSEFIFFVIGMFIGGNVATIIMCCLQINRLKNDEEDCHEKKND